MAETGSPRVHRDIDNLFAIVHELAAGNTRWSARPAWLEFSTNNLCNLRCVMCPQAEGVPTVIMDRADAERVLGEALPHVSLVTPSAGSEPVLGDLDLLVEHCRHHEVLLDMYSNGTVLDAERFRAMADRVHRLHISLDSHIAETFEAIRPGARFQKVLRNVQEILPIALEQKVPLGFIFVWMADNASQLPDYVDFLSDLGVARARAEICVRPLLHLTAEAPARDADLQYTLEQQQSFIDEAARRATERGLILKVDLPAPLQRTVVPVEPPHRGATQDLLKHMVTTLRNKYPHFCNMAAYYLKISPDGSVFPCCRAPDELCMGNVRQQTVHEVWNGERYQEFRRRMLRGDYAECCRGCDVLVGNPAFPGKTRVQTARA